MDTTHKRFYIIMGRSGCGKGTQAELLKKALEDKGVTDVVHVTTGAGFRAFIEGPSHAARISKDLTNSGGLNPEFLAIWNWSNIFITSLTGKETIILDGAPRKPIEVGALHSAVHFFGYEHPTIIYVDVSETWAMDKLASRGREDDMHKEEQEKKMAWFAADVLPCLDMYMRDPLYTFIHVNGEQTVEDVHGELMKKLDEVRH
jgi:adenylate kinase family enzyme